MKRTLTATSIWKARITGVWSDSQKIATGRLPFALFACGMLAYAAGLAWHFLTSFDLVDGLIGVANADDAFYYFQIAYNLAQGKFSTFDGGITQTNGYNPAWLLLITPFYWLFDKETALLGIKTLEVALVASGAVVITAAARVARLAWPLLFAALPMLFHNPYELLWGMEAALALFALALLILAACLYMRDPDRWKWHVAAIAFALPWVRIECIAVSLSAAAALCVIEWSRQERRSLRLSELANMRQAYIPLIGAIAGILLYFAYNWLVFGGILPVSAAAKLASSQAQWAREGGYIFIENFRYAIRRNIFDYELRFALEICAYLLIAWRLALRSNDMRDWLLVAFLIGMFGLAAEHIAKFVQTVLTVHPYTESHVWYFVPAYLITALIIPIRLYIAILLIRRFIAPRWRIAANALSIGVVVIGAAVLLGRAGFAEPFRWVDQESRATKLDWNYWNVASYMGVQVMNGALPEGSVIGSWDAGVIGYFSRFPVVNLDGLVNSYDHLRARPVQQTEGLNFYRRYGITHFANNQRLYHDSDETIPIYSGLNATANNVIFEGAPFDDRQGDRQFRLWTYDLAPDSHAEIDYSQWIWDSLQPHFDYASDGVGVILAGRTAHAFAKNCTPDESLGWTWRDQNHERFLISPSLYRTSVNMCVASRLLPRGNGQPSQIKIAPLKAYFANLTTSRAPIIRSNFDVYISDGSLIYAKRQCSQADIKGRFFANIYPVDEDDLPNNQTQRGYDGIDFIFANYGASADEGNCWTALALPDYAIAEIHAGQYVEFADGYEYIWDASYKVGAVDRRVAVKPDFETLASRAPIIRSEFDVHLIDGSLIYAKRQCDQADVAERFFVNIYPVESADLPAHLRQRGYETIDFNFADYGAIAAEGNCWAGVRLPNYSISEIHTGQYVETVDGYTHIWEGFYRLE